jgi:hypothetical protein
MTSVNKDLNESTVASNDLTFTDSRHEEEKVIDIENGLVASTNDAVATTPEPTNVPPRPTGIRFALIFVGYVPVPLSLINYCLIMNDSLIPMFI